MIASKFHHKIQLQGRILLFLLLHEKNGADEDQGLLESSSLQTKLWLDWYISWQMEDATASLFFSRWLCWEFFVSGLKL